MLKILAIIVVDACLVKGKYTGSGFFRMVWDDCMRQCNLRLCLTVVDSAIYQFDIMNTKVQVAGHTYHYIPNAYESNRREEESMAFSRDRRVESEKLKE
jgi:hypothetical protein